MSLDRVQKKVQGVVGRGPPTHVTELKSWNAFEDAVSLIWRNAREYNEDGSDIYNLSLELEVGHRPILAVLFRRCSHCCRITSMSD